MNELRLTVAIPTYRRPELLRAGLALVIEQTRAATSLRADVLVVDNDADGSAHATVVDLGADDVRYVVEPTPGIVAARNRALDEATAADLLVFLDDDERPRAGWLDALVQTYLRTGAAAVSGRVITQFDVDSVDPWVVHGRLFERPSLPTGTSVQVVATGNLLLDLRQIRSMNIRFDSRIGLAGGEDTLMSRQLAQRGALMVACAESVADDPIVAERLTRRWLIRRALSQGNARARVEILLTDDERTARGRALARGCARIAVGGSRAALGFVIRSPRHQARGCRMFFAGLGMAAAASGQRVEEYARPEGRRWPGRGRKRGAGLTREASSARARRS